MDFDGNRHRCERRRCPVVIVSLALPPLGQSVCRSRALPHPAVYGGFVGRGSLSAAFGAMLLSVALWKQTAWGWSALQTGSAIAPGPLLVPITSLLLAGRLIKNFGAASVISAGIFSFAAGLVWYALAIGSEPSALAVVIGMIPTGIGVGLTYPTLMGVSGGALPPSAFATGSGVVNMIRQASMAIGVAVFVAIVGSPASLIERVAAFHFGWWVFVAIVMVSLVPTLALIGPKRSVVAA